MPERQSSAAAITIRLPRTLLRQIDAWAASQGKMTRSDAIQRLLRMTLKSTGKKANVNTSNASTAHAAGMAGQMIDYLSDQSASAADRQNRKNRLLKGPSEFREMREAHSAKRKNA